MDILKTISPLDWARESNTIPWEILCSFKKRHYCG